ncbi:MAG: xanthine dehydrogenase family protein molybdopterin-binding subunit, partial [Paracoccaceae bacterium]
VEVEDAPAPPETAFLRRFGNLADTDAALARAAHVVTRPVHLPRVHAMALEPRGCWATPLPEGRLHLNTGTQSPAGLTKPLAHLLGLDQGKVRITAGDVGGSFGLKGFLTREEALVALAALRLGRPVGWMATRAESFQSDHNGRGISGAVTLALDKDLRFIGLKASLELDAGAYVSGRALGIVNNVGGLIGVYDIPVAHAELRGVTSDKTGIAPYRGHGRPEVTLAIEQTIDAAARLIKIDPVALRRLNLIPAAKMPCRTALTFTYDCGDFAAVLDRALSLSKADTAPARRADARRRGQVFGRGVILCIEAAGGPARAPRPDHVILCATGDGRVILSPGVMSVGQGHETTLTALAARSLGIAEDRIAYVQGDSDILPDGRGNGGSSGLAVTGPALQNALTVLSESAVSRCAAALGCDPAEIRREGDLFRQAGTNNALSLAQVASLCGPDGLRAQASFTPNAATFPNGAHVAEIEIDPATGAVTILSYTAVEDVGTVLAPRLVEGQMMGGIAQGISQVLGERMVHDSSGQVLTGSLMDYRMMRADEAFVLRLETHAVPTAINPLGVKGVGEAGTVGSVAAMSCAIHDTLASLGVTDFALPATPEALWAAIRAAE